MIMRIIIATSTLFLIGFGYMYWVVLSSPKPDARVLFEAAFTNPVSEAQALKADGYSTVFGSSRAWVTFKSQSPPVLREAAKFKPTNSAEFKRYLPKDCAAVIGGASSVQSLQWYDRPNKNLKLLLSNQDNHCYYEQRERGARQ